MWHKLLIFIPLAVLSNTVLPVPFEPILLAFAIPQKHSVWVFVLIGTICAAAGSWIDVRLSHVLREKQPIRTRTQLYGFYLSTVLCAFFPIPFSFIRVALLKIKPRTLPYMLAVMAGRFPRYWMIAHLGVSIFYD